MIIQRNTTTTRSRNKVG